MRDRHGMVVEQGGVAAFDFLQLFLRALEIVDIGADAEPVRDLAAGVVQRRAAPGEPAVLSVMPAETAFHAPGGACLHGFAPGRHGGLAIIRVQHAPFCIALPGRIGAGVGDPLRAEKFDAAVRTCRPDDAGQAGQHFPQMGFALPHDSFFLPAQGDVA